MGLFAKFDRAAVLVGGMATRLGVNFGGTPEGAAAFRTAVVRCSGCRQSEACAGWQVEHASAGATPSYCRNRDAFKAMTPR